MIPGRQVWRLSNGTVELGVSEVGAQLGPVLFRHGNRSIEPMHVAPWTNEPEAAGIPMLQNLRGDFFCAPFGSNDLLAEETRDHGRTANGRWRELEATPTRLELELEGSVSGAKVRKELWLAPEQPVIYQRHSFEGGSGTLPMGHHAMLRAPEGERLLLSFSPWVWAGTPPDPVEDDPRRGRSLLRYPQQIESLARVATAAGNGVDLSAFPALESSEEILLLVTHPEEEYAWSAAVAPESGWLWFAIRPNRILRSTMLWMSNGGRDYPPFLGRHRRVVGIEEVTSCFHLGHRASAEPNELSRKGLPTSVKLDPSRPTTVHYAFGTAPAPPGFGRVTKLAVGRREIAIEDGAGGRVRVPFDGDFLELPPDTGP